MKITLKKLQCCEMPSKFVVVYNYDSEYLVCQNCIENEPWRSDIKSIREVSE